MDEEMRDGMEAEFTVVVVMVVVVMMVVRMVVVVVGKSSGILSGR
jgi:hypothetical protein